MKGTASDKRRWQKSHIPKCDCARCAGKRQGYPRETRKIAMKEASQELTETTSPSVSAEPKAEQ